MKYYKRFSEFLFEARDQVIPKWAEMKIFDQELADKMVEARVNVIERFPEYIHLASTIDIVEVPLKPVMVNGKPMRYRKVKTACTDGLRVFYNPEWVRENCSLTKGKTLNFNMVCGLYLHELSHIYYEHFKRFEKWGGEYKHSLNFAMDAVIDSYIHFHTPYSLLECEMDERKVNYRDPNDPSKIIEDPNITKYNSHQMHLMLSLDIDSGNKKNISDFNKLVEMHGVNRDHILQLREVMNRKPDEGEKGDSDIIDASDGNGSGEGQGEGKPGGFGDDVRPEGSISNDLGMSQDSSHIDQARDDSKGAKRQNDQARSAGKGSGSAEDKSYNLSDQKVDLNWQAKMAQFLSLDTKSHLNGYSRPMMDQSGMMIRTIKHTEEYEFDGGALLVFLDTSGSISDQDYSKFVTVLCSYVNEYDVRHVQIIPVSQGIHLDGKIEIKIEGVAVPRTIDNMIKMYKLKSKGGTSDFHEIFDYCNKEFIKINSKYGGKLEELKVVIFTDGFIADKPIKESKWPNVKAENVLWVIYDYATLRHEDLWFGEYAYMKNTKM